MASGRVKWFNKQRGFGFIIQEEGPDVFVHYRDIKGMEGFRKLREGDKVVYDLVPGEKGPKAENVFLERLSQPGSVLRESPLRDRTNP